MKKKEKVVLSEEEKKAQTKKTRKVLRRLAIKMIVYPVLIFAALYFAIGIYQVHDNDMFPSLRDGDLIITYKLGGYYTGDVVVYKAEGKTHYGRITAVEGDEVLIMEDGYYALNGNIPYEQIFYPTKPGPGLTYPYTVKPGEVFILGDMRQEATDSRALGAIPTNMLRGKVVLLLFRGRGF